jgi:hypothetical protein
VELNKAREDDHASARDGYCPQDCRFLSASLAKASGAWIRRRQQPCQALGVRGDLSGSPAGARFFLPHGLGKSRRRKTDPALKLEKQRDKQANLGAMDAARAHAGGLSRPSSRLGECRCTP